METERWQDFVRRFREGSCQEYAEHWERFQELVRSAPEAEGPAPVWWPGDRDLEESNLATLLRELGIESVVYDPCGNRPASGDFLTVMQANADHLERIAD